MSVCEFKADTGYLSVCGAEASYEVWGDPCSCTHVYDLSECRGHTVCVEHGARVRMVEVRIHKEREHPFKLTRICDLPSLPAASEQADLSGTATNTR